MAGGTGTYYYVEGELRTDYYFPVPGVWSAVEKTIADMKGRDVEPDRQTDGGKIVAVINDEKVTFRLKYKDKDLTTLGIRVGLVGNETASKMLHDRVAVSYTHLRAHETPEHLVCRLLLEKKNQQLDRHELLT